MKIISSKDDLKYFKEGLTESNIVDAYSDFKHRIFPRSFERLKTLRDSGDLVGVEIGVGRGEHARSLLETLNIAKLYLIDPYEMYEAYVAGGSINYGDTQLPLSQAFIEAQKILKPFEKKITWIKKMSNDAMNDIEETLDFVYIDGNHDYEFVKNDIENYYPHLKKGGVIGGHDFYNGFAKTHNGVVTAVTQFTVSKAIQLYVEQPDWWFYKE